MAKAQRTLDKLSSKEIDNDSIVSINEDLFNRLCVSLYGKTEMSKDSHFHKGNPEYGKINGAALKIYIDMVSDESMKSELSAYLKKS